MKGAVYALCMGKERGVAKRRVKAGSIRTGHGFEGDAHAGHNRRQISLLAFERIRAANREKNLNAGPGDFAENITTTGIDWSAAVVGAQVTIGAVRLRIVGRGKPEHGPGDYSFYGVALLAEEGIFAEVIEGGCVAEGDTISVCANDSDHHEKRRESET